MSKKDTLKKTTTKQTVDLLQVTIDAMQEKKAEGIISLDLQNLENSICKYFVICNADSSTQVVAIADNIEDRVLEHTQEKVWRRSGFENAFWIILDYGDVVIHIFQTEQREFYRLEELWADAELTEYKDLE